MPILPPRNLPLSPPGKPVSSKNNNKNTTSTPPRKIVGIGSPSTPSSPSRARGNEAGSSSSPYVHSSLGTAAADLSTSSISSSTSGQLTREEETTFHRRLRTLLWDHRTARDNWDDIVSIQGAKSVASVARLAQRLDELVKANDDQKELPEGYDSLPEPLRITKAELQARRADELAKTLKSLKEEQSTLEAILPKINKALAKLQTLNEAAETLLIEATRTKGDLFAFEQEAWLTWPISRFVSIIQEYTVRYSIQTDHLQTIVDILFDQGCVTGRSASIQDDDQQKEKKEGVRGDDNEEDEEEEENEDTQESPASKKARKLRALIRQRIMEEWQALPHLRDEHNPDPMWFEDVCSAEVGRWDER
ncbi:uncharacterized protein FA14DRAFT_189279 [Meira miltonrushii]|uniref:Uncharacterized protein n=1 Tax=Meira miltonrushii TaxID=1280837 RepID=A0A316VD96_9BASI|nr:uncharacterized protein FA14DRAFT_189279 [Meira miltonrushii]PWN35294.1 hypothetical protein FA14DRAFT_189279 [Meira miltonrushii]